MKSVKTRYTFTFNCAKKAEEFTKHAVDVVGAKRNGDKWVIETIRYNNYERTLWETKHLRDGEEEGGYVLDVKMHIALSSKPA